VNAADHPSGGGAIDGSLFGEQNRCFGCGPRHPFGFRLQCEADDDGVRAVIVPGEQYQGAPGMMHGGLISTLADEIGAYAIIARLGKFGFTTEMKSRFKAAVRIGEPTEARARIRKDRRRLVDVEVTISQRAGVCYEGELTFVLLAQAQVEKLLGGPIPEAWQRFAR
jgi:acyl-coenzyme A thioesterase PaaI-like protein